MENEPVYDVVLDEPSARERIDSAIATLCPELSRTRIQKLIKEGLITVNGKSDFEPNEKFPAGTSVHIVDKLPVIPIKAEPESIPLEIIYEDDEILVINKPAGMVVHPAAGNWHGTVVNAILGRDSMPDDEDFDPMRPGIVHRLDKDTSGALLIAKTAKSLRILSKSFANREVKKTYLALVHGWPTPTVNIIDQPIGRHQVDRRKMAVMKNGLGREAVTLWRVIRTGRWNNQKIAVMELHPRTGRTHQIRVHMSYCDYPLLGEKLYNRGRTSTAERQMLHARRIEFQHPVTEKPVSFEAPLPDDFRAIIDAMEEEK